MQRGCEFFGENLKDGCPTSNAELVPSSIPNGTSSVLPKNLQPRSVEEGFTSRRGFLAHAGALGVGASLAQYGLAAEDHAAVPLGRAEHCIFLWLGGGMAQMDTWDPKAKGDPVDKKPGSYYESVPTAVRGVRVCEHLARCADLMDRFAILRTVHHEVIDEHAAAVNRMHTGRPTSGTIVYPSLGSIVAYEKAGAEAPAPPYVLVGYPNLTRGPGFLGARHSFLYLLDTESGPAALARPKGITDEMQAERSRLLAEMRRGFLARHPGEKLLADYDTMLDRAAGLSGPEFMNVFKLDEEPAELRESYGGEFGQRCLLARRLIQRGARFIELSHNLNFVNGTGWDVHNQGILNQHLLIEELDRALSTLTLDLERHKLLDKTLIVVSTEFGRPAGFDGGGGRGHYSKTFSVVIGGGGLNTGRAVGETDELAENIVSRPVSVPDLFATIVQALGIDPRKELYAGNRPVPITDQGSPIPELFGRRSSLKTRRG